ncbi:MAG: TIGR01906 family membrane protein [Oscillospiraceae bacterium]|nr:TIGR01906 family membrane protein [Oscillospiraceae bacterium]
MKNVLLGTLLAIASLLFTTALGLGILDISDFPYKADISYLRISENSGLTREEILLNYDAIMSFLSPFSNEEFFLPTISYTDRAKTHFEECKPIFNTVYISGAASALVLLALILLKAIPKRLLKVSGAVTLIIPAVIGTAVAVDFNSAFNFFHKILFNDSTWIFDPNVDRFITIMPETFFMHCAIFIAFFWAVGAAIQFVLAYAGHRERKL